MTEVVSVKFKDTGKAYYFSPAGKSVKVGDRVLTSKYSGTEVKCDGVEYIIVKQSDILAIVE